MMMPLHLHVNHKSDYDMIYDIDPKCFERWILGLLPQITLRDMLKHFDSVITIICLPFGTMSAKFVDENRSST